MIQIPLDNRKGWITVTCKNKEGCLKIAKVKGKKIYEGEDRLCILPLQCLADVSYGSNNKTYPMYHLCITYTNGVAKIQKNYEYYYSSKTGKPSEYREKWYDLYTYETGNKPKGVPILESPHSPANARLPYINWVNNYDEYGYTYRWYNSSGGYLRAYIHVEDVSWHNGATYNTRCWAQTPYVYNIAAKSIVDRFNSNSLKSIDRPPPHASKYKK